ncbi:MAG: hypothetical protein ABEL76_12790 [Bradymonadaceae bacterium]
MACDLPIVHVPSVGDEGPRSVSEESIGQLLDLLAAREYRSPAASSLWMGSGLSDGHRVLTATSATDVRSLARWGELHGDRGFASLLFVSAASLGRSSSLSADEICTLTGMGIVVAARGSIDRPLVELGPDELRARLERQRKQLADLAGYDVCLLAPVPSPSGRAVDGLVQREAERAGFRRLLVPGNSPATTREGGIERWTYRTWQPDESVYQIRDWVLGGWHSRASAKLRSIADRSRRLFEGLAGTETD